jgi:hypothetical protein
MLEQTGNLSRGERIGSALLGVGLTLLATRRGGVLSRVLGGVIGTSLLGRALAGHCGMKAALTGESTLKQGLADQWRRTSEMGRGIAQRVSQSTRERIGQAESGMGSGMEKTSERPVSTSNGVSGTVPNTPF